MKQSSTNNDYKNSSLTIYYQNSGRKNNEIDELVHQGGSKILHLIPLTEYLLSNTEINYVNIDSCNLRACFCRKSRKNGGVSVFVNEALRYTFADLNESCIDLDIEIYDVKLHYSSSNTSLLSTYRSPSGNFSYFLKTLASILNRIYTNSLNIIISRHINISYLDNDNNNEQKLNSLLATFNLFSIIDFPTRINNISMSAIVNFFIDKYKNENFTINSLQNGLSDHDAQLLVLNNIKIQNPSIDNQRRHK